MACRSTALLTILAAASAAELASSSAADSCGSQGGGHAGICQDLQNERSGEVATELLQLGAHRNADKQIPGFGDLVDSVTSIANSSVQSITDSVSSIANSSVQSIADSVSSIANASSIDDIVNSVTDAVQNTSSINDIVSSVAGAVQNTSSMSDALGSIANSVLNGTSASVAALTGGLADSAAAAVAEAMNQSLVALGSQADAFVASCKQAKDSLMVQMNSTEKAFAARVAVLEANATSAVNAALPVWDQLTATVGTSSSAVTSVLDSVGLSNLSVGLNKSLSQALSQAEVARSSLQNVSGLISNLSNIPQEVAGQQLSSIQDMLQRSLEQVDGFAVNFSNAFGELTDSAAAKIAETIPGANATSIDAAFDQVDLAVADVASKVVSGPESLVVGLSDATGMVEDTLPQARSFAHRAGPFALVAFAVLAVPRL